MRKLFARRFAYSSVVGGGLTLTLENGRAAFIVSFVGTSEGITKEENAAIAEQLERLINEHGLEISDR